MLFSRLFGAASTAPETAAAKASTAWLACLVAVAHARGLHLTVEELMHDNALESAATTPGRMMACAARAGFHVRRVRAQADDLARLGKAAPAILGLIDGSALVLLEAGIGEDGPRIHLRDPLADNADVTLDPLRLARIWSGDLILLRRHHDLADEDQPFSMRLIAGLIFRERRLVRDIAISALILSLFALAPILFWRLLSERVVYYGAMNTFAVVCIAMLAVTMFEAAFAYLRAFLLQIVSTRVDTRISEYMFERLLALPTDYFERTQVGKTAHDMSEYNKIRNFLTGQLFGTVLDSLTLFVFLPVMLAFSPLLTFIVLGVCGLIVVWLILMLPTVRRANERVIEAETVRGSFLYQTLAGMRTVKSLALEVRQQNGWDAHTARVSGRRQEAGFVAALISAVVRPLERLAVNGSYAVGVYIAVTTHDAVYISALFAFLMLSQRVSAPLMQMAALVTQYDEARAAVAVVADLVNRPKEERSSGKGVKTPLAGHVEFLNLRFKYPGATTYALDGVSFEVPIGATLGVVGRSGSGKTTVTRLLQRLHSDYEGLVKIDGVDIREYDLAHLRRSLGVVLQENFLFSGTIRENIAAARPQATFEDVVQAARLAGAEEFIDRLPRGYETFIYEGSPNLSGGQRQRLAIARALILDPRILILDEATSALDPDSEAIVNENIRRIARGRTVIVISHRLSSLVNSDAILVLERGKFEDMGTHDELLARCEIYSGLWNQQNRHTNARARAEAQKGPTRVS